MNDYTHYSANDFIADEEFQAWVRNPDAVNTAFWNEWIKDNPGKKAEVAQAIHFLTHLQFNTHYPSNALVEASLSDSLNQIALLENRAITNNFRARKARRYSTWLAFIFVVVLAFIGWHLAMRNSLKKEVLTRAGEIVTLILPDSTIVTLNGNSSVIYYTDLDSHTSREVWLKGEAFFDVVPGGEENKLTFTVHTARLDVQVMGTTFNVKERGQVYNVSVNKGKIKVRLHKDPYNTIVVRTGGFFQYDHPQREVRQKRVEPLLYAGWVKESTVLQKVPLRQLTTLLQDVYGYTVYTDSSVNANRQLSGTIIMKNADSLLNTLSALAGVRFEQRNDTVFVKASQLPTP